MANLAPWVVETARWPLAFAQVREDPLLDFWVVEQIGDGAQVLMIASGGCTAARLAASGKVSHLHLVDMNPAQIALSRLKLRLLQTADQQERLALLGHVAMDPAERARRVSEELAAMNLSPHVFGPVEGWAQLGPDHAGRYELVFAKLRERLKPVSLELEALLGLENLNDQMSCVAPETRVGQAIDHALDEVMALPNLVALFSEQATRNRVESFAQHFARRTRHALATLPATNNPYLWQMYAGRFPPGTVYPWFTTSHASSRPQVDWSNTDMVTALRSRTKLYDFVHLSNILDWLSVEEGREILELAAGALRPGGWALIRQLNSTLDIPSLGPAFSWQPEQAAQMHSRDRSFFYRALHLGRRQ